MGSEPTGTNNVSVDHLELFIESECNIMTATAQAMGTNHVVQTSDIPWEPWSKYFPGAPEPEGKHGGWLKVLRRPTEEFPGWTFLFKWVHGWPGKTVKHVALVPPDGDEHIYILNGPTKDLPYADMEGTYTYRGPNARHGGNFGSDFMALITYSGSPDIIVSHTFLDAE